MQVYSPRMHNVDYISVEAWRQQTTMRKTKSTLVVVCIADTVKYCIEIATH